MIGLGVNAVPGSTASLSLSVLYPPRINYALCLKGALRGCFCKSGVYMFTCTIVVVRTIVVNRFSFPGEGGFLGPKT